MNKLFVGNLSWDTSEDELQKFFEECGQVKSTKIITDKNSGKSKGFGFVEMETSDEAKAAIEKLHDKPLRTRNLRVSLAQERQERPERSDRGDRPSRPYESRGGDRNDRGSDRGERREYRGGGNSEYSGPRTPYSGNRSR